MSNTQTKKKIDYSTTGVVIGNTWGGGVGAYKATPISSSTKEGILEEAKKKIEDGSLDSGMGYESLFGAILSIKKTTTIVVDEKEFKSNEYEIECVGDLTEEQQDFLFECLMLQ